MLLVEASYDVAFELCFALSQEEGWYCRNTGINPFTTEGKKTVAFEIAAQLGWQLPDAVVVSVGDGSIVSSLHKGFRELYQLGWTRHEPQLIGVRRRLAARRWCMLHRQGIDAADMQPQPAQTLADSISAGLPRDRAKALRAVRETQGSWLCVPDEAILAAIPRLARASGIFAEPAAAAALAGLEAAVAEGVLGAESSVVLLVTGNGLKDVHSARRAVSGGLRVAPDAGAIRRALRAQAS